VLILTDKDVRSVLKVSQVIECVERSFHIHGQGESIMPPAAGITVSDDSRIMGISAYVKPLTVAGLKWGAAFRYNTDRYGLPTHITTIFLNDAATGVPLAVMDGNWITAMRTGAVTAVGAKYLARRGAKNIGIIGSGVQARSNLETLNKVLKIETIKVTSRRTETRKQFAEEMGAKLGLKILPVDSSDEVTKDADVVVSTAPASYPFIRDELAKEGVLVVTLGSHIQTDPYLPKKVDKIVIDDLYGSFFPSGMGHFAEYVREGIVTEKDVYAQLGEIVVGKKRGRISGDERIWFSHAGMAIHDVVVGYEVYKMATKRALGINVKLF
jgi:ornithine cyclodeaminase/alanine dehydrogenase-like protein (mu-crystallin family)